ncbi:MAG: NUDIX hydrolase [Desulfobacteraceae bacterium]|nr:NUDIX hydrolase [Desulfobacteraceae bacterium]
MTVKVKHKQLIRRGRVFDINLEKVTFPSGFTTEMDILRHPGAAAIVAMDQDGMLLILEQYRHALGKTIWEIPAGTLEKNEKPESCARRELIEETGYSASQWQYLGATTPVPGYADEKIHIYLAHELVKAEQKLDSDEIVKVHKLPVQQIVNMIVDGRIEDGKTVAGLFLALHKMGYGFITPP